MKESKDKEGPVTQTGLMVSKSRNSLCVDSKSRTSLGSRSSEVRHLSVLISLKRLLLFRIFSAHFCDFCKWGFSRLLVPHRSA